MIFSKNVRRIVTAVGVASPFILSLGTSASAHVVTAQHAQIAAHTAVMARMAHNNATCIMQNEDVVVAVAGANVMCGMASDDK